jgi:hypothetical protein
VARVELRGLVVRVEGIGGIVAQIGRQDEAAVDLITASVSLAAPKAPTHVES